MSDLVAAIHHWWMPDMVTDGPIADIGKQLLLPVAALAAGGCVWCLAPSSWKILAQILLFFGAQTFMNIYMKAVLSQSVVSEEFHMKGFQAPLLLTAIQQLVGFLFLACGIGLSQLTSWPYSPRKITKREEVVTILALSAVFTTNIAMNNFSLALLDVSTNVMIRSMAPVTALIVQLVFKPWLQDTDFRLGMFALIAGGSVSTVLVVLAKRSGSGSEGASNFTLGVVVCCISCFFASLELVLVAIVTKKSGTNMKLNSIDTVLYMALPIILLLVPPSILLVHPVSYGGYGLTTDWHVFVDVWRLNLFTIVLVFMSGIFAVLYLLLLYTVVRDISPVFATFASSFNKAAVIALALVLRFETLPSAPWSWIMVLGVIGNMTFFAAYALYPKKEKAAETEAQAQVAKEGDSLEELGAAPEPGGDGDDAKSLLSKPKA